MKKYKEYLSYNKLKIHVLTSKWGLRMWITIGNNAEMENWKQLRLCPLALCSEIVQTNLGLLYACCNAKRHHWNIHWVSQCPFLLFFLYQIGSVLWSVSTCPARVVHAQLAFLLIPLCRVRHIETLSNCAEINLHSCELVVSLCRMHVYAVFKCCCI